MSFWKNLFFKNEPEQRSVKLVSDRNNWLQTRYQQLFKGGKVDKDKALVNSTFFTCVNILSNTIAKNKIYIYRYDEKGRKVKYTDHQWYNALAYSPNPNLSSHKLWSTIYVDTYNTGNGFAYIKEYDNLNPVNQIVPINSKLEKVKELNGEYWYKFEWIEPYIPSSKLIHNYLISKDGGITGMNPVESIMTELQIQKYGEEAIKNFYQQGLTGTLFFEPQLDLTPANKQKLNEKYDQLQSEFMGYHNAGKIPTIPIGYSLKSIPAQQIDFLASNKYTVSAIGSLMGVPEILLGTTNSSTIGKAEEQMLFFKNSTINNHSSMLINELNKKLLTPEERATGVHIAMDFSSLYDTDMISKANFLKTLSSTGAITQNEIREAIGYEASENEYMNYHWLQKQNAPLELYPTWDNNKIEIKEESNDSNL